MLDTSVDKLLNQYITPLFRTISTRLGTLHNTFSEKLANQYVTSLFITILTIACVQLRESSIIVSKDIAYVS